jgi:hypothetical protein
MTYSFCTHKKIGKKLIFNPPPLVFVTCLAPISLCLRKLINHAIKCTLAFASHYTTFSLPSMHIFYLFWINGIPFCKKVDYFCVRFDTIMYSLQYGCHLFEYTWENVEYSFRYLMWPVQKSCAPYMKHIL